MTPSVVHVGSHQGMCGASDFSNKEFLKHEIATDFLERIWLILGGWDGSQ